MKKQKSLHPLLPGIAILTLYFAARLHNLLALPIFTDEAIYIRWTQLALSDTTQRFISLTDGKQPSFIWVGMFFIKYISDPLLAMRLISVIAGGLTVLGLWFLAKELFNDRRVAYAASILYVIFPFAIICDKLALYDSLVAMLAVWALYLEVLLVKKRRLDTALIAGLVIGVGLLTKSSALFFLYLLPFSLILFDFKSRTRKVDFAKWLGLAAITFTLATLCAFILRLSPYFYIIGEKNTMFVYPIGEWIKHPFTYVIENLKSLLPWFIGYMTIPTIFLVISALFINKKFLREKLLLLMWFSMPFTALAFFGKLIFPRFIFFMTIPLLVLAAYGLVSITDKIKARHWKVLAVSLLLINMVILDVMILVNISKAPIPRTDKLQLTDGYASGVGVDETVAYLKNNSKDRKIFVGTEGTFGLMPDALQVYLANNQNVSIKGYWPITDVLPEEVVLAAKTKPTYFVVYAACPPIDCNREPGRAPKSWPVKKVFDVQRPDKSFYTLYQVYSP